MEVSDRGGAVKLKLEINVPYLCTGKFKAMTESPEGRL